MAFRIVDRIYTVGTDRKHESMGIIEGHTSNTVGETFLRINCMIEIDQEKLDWYKRLYREIPHDVHDFDPASHRSYLMKKLAKAGSDHRKFMRQILVSVDITAPLYWWKEFDTYKVGTTANSTSTMHKIHAKEFEIDDFSHEHLYAVTDNIGIRWNCLEKIIQHLNAARECYLSSKDKDVWYQMIQLLPSSYNQKRTITVNYENLVNMYHARKNHKLDEWREFCDWIKELPYNEIITGEYEVNEKDS